MHKLSPRDPNGWSPLRQKWFGFWVQQLSFNLTLAASYLYCGWDHHGLLYRCLRRLSNWCEDIGRFEKLGWEIYD